MKNLLLKIGWILIIIHLAVPLRAQSSTTTTTTTQGFDMTDMPQWAKDLRRGEIVAFGTFPFTLFFSGFLMDTYRTASNDWDRRYAPFPFTAAGSVSMTQNERLLTLGFAVGGSILIAVVDHLVVRYRRNKLAQEILSQSPGTPIIIRQPMDSSGNNENGSEPENENP